MYLFSNHYYHWSTNKKVQSLAILPTWAYCLQYLSILRHEVEMYLIAIKQNPWGSSLLNFPNFVITEPYEYHGKLLNLSKLVQIFWLKKTIYKWCFRSESLFFCYKQTEFEISTTVNKATNCSKLSFKCRCIWKRLSCYIC